MGKSKSKKKLYNRNNPINQTNQSKTSTNIDKNHLLSKLSSIRDEDKIDGCDLLKNVFELVGDEKMYKTIFVPPILNKLAILLVDPSNIVRLHALYVVRRLSGHTSNNNDIVHTFSKNDNDNNDHKNFCDLCMQHGILTIVQTLIPQVLLQITQSINEDSIAFVDSVIGSFVNIYMFSSNNSNIMGEFDENIVNIVCQSIMIPDLSKHIFNLLLCLIAIISESRLKLCQILITSHAFKHISSVACGQVVKGNDDSSLDISSVVTCMEITLNAIVNFSSIKESNILPSLECLVQHINTLFVGSSNLITTTYEPLPSQVISTYMHLCSLLKKLTDYRDIERDQFAAEMDMEDDCEGKDEFGELYTKRKSFSEVFWNVFPVKDVQQVHNALSSHLDLLIQHTIQTKILVASQDLIDFLLSFNRNASCLVTLLHWKGGHVNTGGLDITETFLKMCLQNTSLITALITSLQEQSQVQIEEQQNLNLNTSKIKVAYAEDNAPDASTTLYNVMKALTNSLQVISAVLLWSREDQVTMVEKFQNLILNSDITWLIRVISIPDDDIFEISTRIISLLAHENMPAPSNFVLTLALHRRLEIVSKMETKEDLHTVNAGLECIIDLHSSDNPAFLNGYIKLKTNDFLAQVYDKFNQCLTTKIGKSLDKQIVEEFQETMMNTSNFIQYKASFLQ